MYLKKLELNGFKSFATKTTLEFLPDCDLAKGGKCGITAIVGPNGSGKSNIADAIRWAIGEQSSKNLRGKKSEDVIFAGTDKKTRLGSASVTLSFDNSDKRIPIEFAEVAITRKIYRSGESEYLVNGSRVRLMDIVDLLAKAGIGKDSYCVITQGMSDALLQATPGERRSIFEDAAGVKQYQIEKDRALRKLESTKANLAQVDGLVIEIEPHLKNLKRQAEKASQGKEIAEKLRAKQLLLYGFLWHNFQSERSSLITDRTRLEGEMKRLDEEVILLQSAVVAASKAMETNDAEDLLEGEIATLRETLNTAVRERSVLEGRRQVEFEKQKAREEIVVIPVDLHFVQGKLDEVRTLQSELIEKLKNVERLEEIQEIREFATVIRERVADLSQQASAGSIREKKVFALPEAEKEAQEARLQALEAEILSLTQTIQATEDQLAQATAKLISVRESSKSGRALFFQKEEAARSQGRLLQSKKDELNDLKVRLARVEVREEDLTNLVQEELQMKPDGLGYDGTPLDRERLEREIARLKVEVEHVGSIDPLVVDEYQETQKRFSFLSTESADLKHAIDSLKEVLREMDEKIDQAFQATFKDVKKKFSEYFKIIFGGGTAELSIVKIQSRKQSEREGDDTEFEANENPITTPEAYEIGIDIVASPPGKRIHNLSMLSGGERSLTSLALLFAIISHNPPPFAVLDEVEAALDEANSRRFGKMLQELSLHTQFVAITHNRETMSQAGLLYGVTMGDEGVSRLLSVRLDQVGEGGKLKA